MSAISGMPNGDISAEDIEGIFLRQRSAFALERNPSLAVRRGRLDRMAALVAENEREIVAAVADDFGTRPAQETRLAELLVVTAGIRHARRHLWRWMRTRRVVTPMYLWPGRSIIIRQPIGVVGVISPWNYPVQLALLPAVAALAAGNRVLIKPSESTPRTAALLQALVARYFAIDELAVVNGGPDVGDAFARLPFDHLFFTGSSLIGRQVALAAADNLTPVTLELGGKSPALIHADADLALIAPRLLVGKLLNAGQTCIAPDYVLAPVGMADALAAALAQSAALLYPTPADNPDYTSIVNEHHYRRLRTLIDEAKCAGAQALTFGHDNKMNARVRKIPPTLLLGVDAGMSVMREEIFGPVLPIETYATLDEAIARINARPRPLAMYMFGGTAAARRRVLIETVAGGVTVDDTLWHFSNEDMPFGGIGASGMGAYHGECGFLTFTHQKSVFIQPRKALTWMLRPPYGRRFEAVLKMLKRML
jgi:coniferyl-aldehyde dehydrogenase